MLGTPLTCGDWRGEVLRLKVCAQPRASRNELAGVQDGRLRVRVTAAPADGAANDQARRLIARAFGVSVSKVTLQSGARHRNKLFLVLAPSHLPGETMVSQAKAGL